jgi:hypothetical protein
MHIFRKNYLKAGTIAVIPHGGYRGRENQSLEGARWLKWISEEEDVYIQHAFNGKEKIIGPYRVDGYAEKTNTVYEYNGCCWHGHTCISNRKQKVPNSPQTMEDVYEKWLTRKRWLLDHGYKVVEMWSCQMRKDLKRNPEMKNFFEEIDDLPQPLNLRNALRGGRTNATSLYYKCGPGEKICFVDVCRYFLK